MRGVTPFVWLFVCLFNFNLGRQSMSSRIVPINQLSKWIALPTSEIDDEITKLLDLTDKVDQAWGYIALCISDPSYKPNDIGYMVKLTQYDTLVSKQEFIDQFHLNKLEPYL